MNRRQYFFLRFLTILIGSLLLNSIAQAGLKFETTRLELKPPMGALHADYMFSFRNSSDQKITVQDVVSSCGCTTAELGKRVYQPGEVGELKGRFTFEGRTGFQQKKITLKTDDPKQPEILLAFQLDIPKVVEVSPIFLYWKLDGNAEWKQAHLKLAEGITSDIPQATFDQEAIELEVKTVKPGQEYELKLKPTDLSRKRMLSIKLSLPLSTGNYKEVLVYVAVK
ncbi:MAG: DUF1573 domain-containing protein [Verrucomicrobiota bacterium]